MNRISFRSINSLIEEVERKKEQINNFKPFNTIVLNKIKDEMNIRTINNSLGISGIRLKERETIMILNGIEVNESYNKEYIETLNLSTATVLIENSIHKKLSIELIEQIHFLCMTNVLPKKDCGHFRNNGVIIASSSHIPPHSSKVKELIESAIKEYYKETDNKLLAIFKFKHALTSIHPFFDGNGRVSRLILNLLLLQNKYVGMIIRAEDQNNYYDGLEYADVYMDYRRYYVFMLEQLNKTYDEYLKLFRISSEA